MSEAGIKFTWKGVEHAVPRPRLVQLRDFGVAVKDIEAAAEAGRTLEWAAAGVGALEALNCPGEVLNDCADDEVYTLVQTITEALWPRAEGGDKGNPAPVESAS